MDDNEKNTVSVKGPTGTCNTQNKDISVSDWVVGTCMSGVDNLHVHGTQFMERAEPVHVPVRSVRGINIEASLLEKRIKNQESRMRNQDLERDYSFLYNAMALRTTRDQSAGYNGYRTILIAGAGRLRSESSSDARTGVESSLESAKRLHNMFFQKKVT